MAKTKHQKLADMMEEMLDAIKEHGAKVARQLNVVQLHFYEPYALFGRPLMTESALRRTFALTLPGSLQNLAPHASLRATCLEFPMLGTIISRPIYLLSECRQSSGDEMWMVPWRVKLVCPNENQSKLERSMAQHFFLYGTRADEISNEIDWFEHDMATFSDPPTVINNGA